MSFILDALKKSETDRQQRGNSEFTNVPTSSRRREGPPGWIWVVGVLLLVNLAVLLGIVLRPGVTTVEPTVQPVEESQPPSATTLSEDRDEEQAEDFASQVAAARESAPPREEPAEVVEPPVQATEQPARVTVAAPTIDTARLPTMQQVQADGTVALPELHVDIHVYSEVAKDRFVFINMEKHNEGSRLAEGPLVEEITPDGVVLSYNGTTFLLPRD
jgi:general secretion pathway protein B